MRGVNDAIERNEVAADIDAPALVETLMVVLCGVGLYAGYLRSYQVTSTVIDIVQQLLEGGFWQSTEKMTVVQPPHASTPSRA